MPKSEVINCLNQEEAQTAATVSNQASPRRGSRSNAKHRAPGEPRRGGVKRSGTAMEGGWSERGAGPFDASTRN